MPGKRSSIVISNFNPCGFTCVESSEASPAPASAVTGPGMGVEFEDLSIWLVCERMRERRQGKQRGLEFIGNRELMSVFEQGRNL